MATEPRERDRGGLEAWAERYAATPERPTSFTTLSGEPIQPLYTQQDLAADPEASIGLQVLLRVERLDRLPRQRRERRRALGRRGIALRPGLEPGPVALPRLSRHTERS